MAEPLLVVILIYLPPPTLTVNPPVITETDSVTLHCQTPPSVSVSQCYVRTVRGKPAKVFPCRQTLTGTELLQMAERSSPAEVNLTCFYLHVYPSPDSDVSSVFIRNLLPPTLTVNPPVITETDSVTLHCQTPPSVSVAQCYFRTVRGNPGKVFPCRQTLTGTELLQMAERSSPAEVNVTCFYLHVYPSPDSDVSPVFIRTLRPPTLTVNPPVITETDSVTLHCQTPPSVSVAQCYFYTLSGGVFSCLKTLTGTELLEMSQQRSPAEVQMKCFYTLKLGGKHYPSPHSDTSSITVRTGIWTFVAVVAGCGVTVGVILLVSGILCNNRRTAGSQEVKGRQEHHNENMETYHMYAAISEEPAASDLKSIMYSTVQSH
ncbi:hypothetical protein KUCAC02_030251 [Chaenocephalus aceratus]|uniref:Uncharacterized protein n=1 Tax=Chaenocephalus aceratus TaxID=36190 RepID=A0ACB9XKL3_CHAAC|nr:hypothetical protein KUCAC02_030251 [Chaenocephalus aceratus]